MAAVAGGALLQRPRAGGQLELVLREALDGAGVGIAELLAVRLLVGGVAVERHVRHLEGQALRVGGGSRTANVGTRSETDGTRSNGPSCQLLQVNNAWTSSQQHSKNGCSPVCASSEHLSYNRRIAAVTRTSLRSAGAVAGSGRSSCSAWNVLKRS